MPKIKPNKGLLKRIKLTSTGKVRYRRAGKSHLLSGKPSKRKRKLRRPGILDACWNAKIHRMLGMR
ncbi:MAG: hypothetical protein KatS3mg102_1865 [Planctomycetota bacterium]|nr:MAG: hypothetical protein KatS3mg102_1865 [Planctomycetota bacterium]